MRSQFIAALFLSAVGSAAANAADISGVHVGGYYGGYAPIGSRIEPIIVYDYEPGVIVRSYWDPPWAYRHYFPKTGHRPKIGRHERDTGHHATRAEDYHRYWSVSSVFAPELPPVGVRPYAIAPGPMPGSRY